MCVCVCMYVCVYVYNVCVLMCVYILVWKTITTSCILTEYDPFLEIDF